MKQHFAKANNSQGVQQIFFIVIPSRLCASLALGVFAPINNIIGYNAPKVNRYKCNYANICLGDNYGILRTY